MQPWRAQQPWLRRIHPLWVEHINGLVNVNPADKLSILIKRTDATGDSSYGAYGTITIHGFVGFLRYDDDHYLLGIRENGIDETTETDPDLLTAAAQVPDRSIIWLDAHTGKFLGVALTVPIDPVQNTPRRLGRTSSGSGESTKGSTANASCTRPTATRFCGGPRQRWWTMRPSPPNVRRGTLLRRRPGLSRCPASRIQPTRRWTSSSRRFTTRGKLGRELLMFRVCPHRPTRAIRTTPCTLGAALGTGPPVGAGRHSG